MKNCLILLVCFALIVPMKLTAAKKKKNTKPQKEVIIEDPKFTAMLTSTAKIVIVDSVVVDSLSFIDAIHVNDEEGYVTSYHDFFREEGNGMVYVNELGNKCIYSKYDTELGGKYLFQSDLLPDGWTVGEPLKGISDGGRLYNFDFPYLMPDGVTLYFSAQSEDGLGGYDIYRTRLDVEEGYYLKPENLGLPFNSDADDYSYVIDEQNKLAFFVSNRRQPKGKVCVYCFIPTEIRQMVNIADENKLRSLARIDRIADSWSNKNEIDLTVARKNRLLIEATNRINRNTHTNNKYKFVINDKTTYYSLTDFKNPDNSQRMKTLISLRQQAENLTTTLQKSRDYYATVPMQERTNLKQEILLSEKQLEDILALIHTIEKTIRNAETQ